MNGLEGGDEALREQMNLTGARVMMVVNNDLTYDNRVLRSATSLADNGISVRLFGFSGGSAVPLAVAGEAEVKLVRSEPYVRRAAGNLSRARRSKGVRAKTHALGLFAKNSCLAARQAGWRGILLGAITALFVFPEALRARVRRSSLTPFMQCVEYAGYLGRHLKLRNVTHIYLHDVRLLPPFVVVQKLRRLGGLERMRLIYDVHEHVVGQTHVYGKSAHLLARLEVRCSKNVAHFIYVSDALALAHSEARPSCASWSVVYNYPSASRRPLHGSCDSEQRAHSIFSGVYSGLLSPLRGVETVIESLGSTDASLEIIYAPHQVGYKDKLVELAEFRGVGGRVSCHPFVDADELLKTLSEWHFGLIPLLKVDPWSGEPILNHEVALTNKLFEYLAAGLPVVVSDCVAQAEYVLGRKVGTVFEGGNSQDCVRAIEELRENYGLYVKAVESLRPSLVWEKQEQELLRPFSG